MCWSSSAVYLYIFTPAARACQGLLPLQAVPGQKPRMGLHCSDPGPVRWEPITPFKAAWQPLALASSLHSGASLPELTDALTTSHAEHDEFTIQLALHRRTALTWLAWVRSPGAWNSVSNRTPTTLLRFFGSIVPLRMPSQQLPADT